MTETGNRESRYERPVRAILTGIADLFRKQPEELSLKEEDRLDGKRVLITGASSGLGLATAAELAGRGARVIMAVRSGIPEKGEAVRKRSGSKQVAMIRVDLTDPASISSLAEEVLREHGPVDILICNAAVVTRQSRKTAAGLDEMFMVNYLAKYLLIRELIDRNGFRKQGGELPRIVIVASESHRNAPGFDWEGFGTYRSYGIGQSVAMYGYYKLLLVTFASELSRRLNREGEEPHSVFVLCPGPVNSNIAREAPKVFQPLLKAIFSLFFRSPEKASRPVVYLASSDEVEGKPFDYLFLMSRKPVDPKAADPANGKRLWELTGQLVKSISSGTGSIS